MSDKVLKITEYTDPLCIWCYAIEPTWRKLDFLAESPNEFHNVLGLMLEDIHIATGYGADSDAKFEQILDSLRLEHREATSRGNLPYSAAHFDGMKQEHLTSLPQSLAFEAMKLQDEQQANLYIRRLREAYHSDDLLPTEGVLFELAKEFDIDQTRFQEAFHNGTARAELDKDIAACRRAGVRGFPTVVLTYGDKQIGFSGYISFERLKSALSELTNSEFSFRKVEATEEIVLEFISRYHRVAYGEITSMFDISTAKADLLISSLMAQGKVKKEDRESSCFLHMVA